MAAGLEGARLIVDEELIKMIRVDWLKLGRARNLESGS
jgi:hypothetical protein